jgi:hypothetical protein
MTILSFGIISNSEPRGPCLGELNAEPLTSSLAPTIFSSHDSARRSATTMSRSKRLGRTSRV